MPKYMLDTNICIYLLKHNPPQVIEKFKQCQVGDVVMSAITWAELLRGCDVYEPKSAFDKLQALIPIVPFDEKASMSFAQLLKNYPHKPKFDTLITAHAISLNLTVVTNNVADFVKFNIPVESWVDDVIIP